MDPVLCGVCFHRALLEENTDLHQNLLHTVVFIEGLQAELTRSREERSRVKDMYKRSAHSPVPAPSFGLTETLATLTKDI